MISRCRHQWIKSPVCIKEGVEECSSCLCQRHTRRDPMFTIREYYKPDPKGVLRRYKTIVKMPTLGEKVACSSSTT